MARAETLNNLIEKVPPQNREAEMSVLGAMLFEVEALLQAMQTLRSEFFYEEPHRRIFSAMQTLFERNQPVDLITVAEQLRKTDSLEAAGGVAYLTQLTQVVPTAAHIQQYCRIVKEKALTRGLIKNATIIVEKCFEQQDDSKRLLDDAEKMIFEITQNQIEGKFYALREIIHDSMERIDQLYQRKEHVTGLATGFAEFDVKTAGLQPSDLIIAAGRPSMGKSAWVSNVCEHVGVKLRKPVAFFSLEMSKEQLVQRMLCSYAHVDAQAVRTGYLSHQDWPKLTKAAGILSESPIFIDDTPGQSVTEIRAKARRMKMQHDIQLVAVDYLQLIRGGGSTESRQQEISQISMSLKELARELRVPVIAVSQLSRAVENRQGNRPMLSDLRESGAIEQDADLVVFLFREEYYNPKPENENKAEAIIAKQRNGPIGTIEMVFQKKFTRFENMETHRTEETSL